MEDLNSTGAAAVVAPPFRRIGYTRRMLDAMPPIPYPLPPRTCWVQPFIKRAGGKIEMRPTLEYITLSMLHDWLHPSAEASPAV